MHILLMPRFTITLVLNLEGYRIISGKMPVKDEMEKTNKKINERFFNPAADRTTKEKKIFAYILGISYACYSQPRIKYTQNIWNNSTRTALDNVKKHLNAWQKISAAIYTKKSSTERYVIYKFSNSDRNIHEDLRRLGLHEPFYRRVFPDSRNELIHLEEEEMNHFLRGYTEATASAYPDYGRKGNKILRISSPGNPLFLEALVDGLISQIAKIDERAIGMTAIYFHGKKAEAIGELLYEKEREFIKHNHLFVPYKRELFKAKSWEEVIDLRHAYPHDAPITNNPQYLQELLRQQA